jgi:hypothetical protein
MQDIKLPADRMIQIGDHLINVDDISTAVAKHQTPAPMIGVVESRWLEITTLNGAKIVVDTPMSMNEFRALRAEKFLPVAEEKGKLEGEDWGESDWEVDDVSTEWFYYHPQAGEWVGVADMGVAMDESKRLNTKHKAVMYRKVSKEWESVRLVSEVPQPCKADCIMNLKEPCGDCEAHYQYWAEVDNSEMDIDWSEYADITSSEWEDDE